MAEPSVPSTADIIAATRYWVDKAVIGLNLCPFAKAVQVKGQVRYVVSEARTAEALLADLKTELEFLQAASPEQTDNTLIIHPHVLGEFFEFQSFLPRANAALKKAWLVGEIQIASFHPQYQFADTEPDAIGNYTNRAATSRAPRHSPRASRMNCQWSEPCPWNASSTSLVVAASNPDGSHST